MKNNHGYRLYEKAFLRTPVYSFLRYDPDRLPELLGTVLFRNAIRLASADFYAVLESQAFVYTNLTGKQQLTLLKYYNRMCFRPVPFGLFAPYSLVRWGDGAMLRLASDEKLSLHVLPRLPALDEEQPGEPMVCVNPTLYKVHREWRYIRSLDNGGRLEFTIGAVRPGSLLNHLVKLLRAGPAGYDEVTAAVAGLTGASPRDAAGFVDGLIREQVCLTSHRTRLISGEMAVSLDPLSEAVTPEGNWYAASERPCLSGSLPEQDGMLLLSAAEALARLTIPRAETAMEQFAKRFSARFGEQRVPLLHALDPDCGINYANLARGAGLPEIVDRMGLPSRDAGVRQEWTAAHQLLFHLTGAAIAKGRGVPAVITRDMVEDLPLPAKSLPVVLPVVFRKTSGSLHIEYAGGASPAALVARFSVFSAEAEKLATEIANLEILRHPKIVFADISQLSDRHTDNISRRRPVYPFELAINTYPGPHAITPDELLVSCRDGEVILECPRLGSRVVPRLASAFNYQRNRLSIFRFLCDLQHEGLCPDLSLDPARFFPGMDYYPRIVFEEVIVSPARWIIPAPATPAQLAAFRKTYQLPQVITCGDYDQQLVFDLDNAPEASFFLACAQGKQQLIIEEYLTPSKTIKNGTKPLAGQVVAFLSREGEIYRPAGPAEANLPVRRVFNPGSEWLFLKIYCTEESTEELLSATIAPLIRANKAILRQWFFIRYNEDGHHIRLRLRTAPQHISTLLEQFQKKAGMTHFTIDPYERELERYGRMIHAVESVFHCSSILTLANITSGKAGKKVWTEFQCAIYVTALILARLLPDDQEVLSLAKSASAHLFREAGEQKPLKIALDQNFRGAGPAIHQLLSASPAIPRVLAGPLKKLDASLDRIVPSANLPADLVHMHLNRTFRFEPRRQELIVWHCLHRYLLSLHARGLAGSWRFAFAKKEFTT